MSAGLAVHHMENQEPVEARRARLVTGVWRG